MRNTQSIHSERATMAISFPMRKSTDKSAEMGARIKFLRQSKGWNSLRAWAREMGVSPGTAHKWESGDTANPQNEILLKMAEKLGTTVHFIVLGPPDGESPQPPAAEVTPSIAGRFKPSRKF